MPTPLGIGQSIDAPLTLANAANRHRIMLQPSPTADPLIGTTLPTDFGSGFLVGGIPIDLDTAAYLPAGANVVMRVAFADTQQVIRGGSTTYAVLISQDDGGAWHAQGSILLRIDAERPRFIAQATRAANDDVLLLVITELDTTTSITATVDGTPSTHAWAGLRSYAGGRAWFLRLPPTTSTLAVTTTTDSGNTSALVVRVPARAPAVPPGVIAWSLPPWLPNDPDLTVTPAVLEAAADARNEAGGIQNAINPMHATGTHLDAHGRTYGVPRFIGEDDTSYRRRVLAVARGQHLTRDTLQAHLTAVAGGVRIEIIDATSQAVEGAVRIDGSRQLDGTWQLGGTGATLATGEYIVRIEAAPTVPLAWITSELHRLRPVGLRPHIQWARDVTLGVARALMGARDLQSNPPLLVTVTGTGDVTATLAATRYLTAAIEGSGDIAATDAIRASVTWIELEAPDA